MRIGHNEKAILKILFEKGGVVSFHEVKEKLSGYGRLKFRKMGWNKHHDTEVKHKSLVRATKTLEEKGLIKRSGYVSHWDNSKITRVLKLILTEEGRMAYLMR